MTTKRAQRAAEVEALRNAVNHHTADIWRLMASLPSDANLGTQRAIATHVARCLDAVSGLVGRETARGEARNG